MPYGSCASDSSAAPEASVTAAAEPRWSACTYSNTGTVDDARTASAGPTRVFSTRACAACAANLAEGRSLPSYACVRVNVSVLVAVVRIVVVTVVDRAAASS